MELQQKEYGKSTNELNSYERWLIYWTNCVCMSELDREEWYEYIKDTSEYEVREVVSA